MISQPLILENGVAPSLLVLVLGLAPSKIRILLGFSSDGVTGLLKSMRSEASLPLQANKA